MLYKRVACYFLQVDRILNTTEAGEILGLDPSRVRVLCEQGRIPSARKIRDAWAMLESQVRAFAAQERRPGRPPRR